MKELMKKNLQLFCMMFVMFALSGSVVEAKSTTVKELKAGNVYYYDLNKDGEREKIRYTVEYEEPSNGEYVSSICECKVYINDKLAYQTPKVRLGFLMYIVDINTKDSYRELCLRRYGDSEMNLDTKIFRYKKKKLNVYCSFYDKENSLFKRSQLLAEQPGNGKIRILSDTPVYEMNFGCYRIIIDYKVSNKKLKKVTGNIYTITTADGFWDASYYLSKTIKIRKGLKDKRTKYKIAKGTKIELKKIYIANQKVKYIYIKTSTGKKGWVKLPKGEFLEELHQWG